MSDPGGPDHRPEASVGIAPTPAKRTSTHPGLIRAGRGLPLVVAGVLVIACLLVGAVAPAVFRSGLIEEEIAQQLRLTTGLELATPAVARFALLPRPHVALGRFTIADPNGTLTVDADGLDGDVRLLPLIAGRIELTAVSLDRPKLTINLDGRAMTPGSVIGRVLRTPQAPALTGPQRLGTVSFVDGTLHVVSKDHRHLPDLAALNLTLDWRDLGSPATLTGSLLVRKAARSNADADAGDVAADIAAWIAAPTSLMRGEHSAIAFRIHADPIDVSSSGDVSASGFRGHVSATSPSVSKFVELLGEPDLWLPPFADTKLDSDVAMNLSARQGWSIDLPNLVLRTDGNSYEGTLALLGGAVPTLSGTLASDKLNAAPFAAPLPAWRDTGGGWATTPLLRARPPKLALDLRVSATHLRLAPLTLDDAAIAIITRGDRIEFALADAKAYGGSAKGRVSVGASGEALDIRGTGSLAGVDAATLTWDAFGRQVAAGTFNAALNLETYGISADALARHASGTLRLDGSDGELTDLDLGRALREAIRQRSDGLAAALRSGRTPFRTLTIHATINDGIATVEDSAIDGAEAHLAVGGSADLPARQIDLHAVADAPVGIVPGLALPRLDLSLAGPFDHAALTARLKP